MTPALRKCPGVTHWKVTVAQTKSDPSQSCCWLSSSLYEAQASNVNLEEERGEHSTRQPALSSENGQRDFSSGPAAKTLHSQCRASRSDPWSGD